MPRLPNRSRQYLKRIMYPLSGSRSTSPESSLEISIPRSFSGSQLLHWKGISSVWRVWHFSAVDSSFFWDPARYITHSCRKVWPSVFQRRIATRTRHLCVHRPHQKHSWLQDSTWQCGSVYNSREYWGRILGSGASICLRCCRVSQNNHKSEIGADRKVRFQLRSC